MKDDPRIRLPVLPSVESVISRARWVSFHPERMDPLMTQWEALLDQENTGWQHPCHYLDGTEETARWIFVLEVLNHCFWPDEGAPTWTVHYKDQRWSGYWGLAAGLMRAMDQGIPVTDAVFLSQISIDELRRIFAGEGEIPLLAERLLNLKEAGRVLQSQWQGDVVRLIQVAEGSAIRLIDQVVSSFPSFQDEAFYHGQKVYFWKRAQIFASDLHLAFQGKRWGKFRDIDSLTAFADYKLPQVLRQAGIIAYHSGLAARVDRREWLEPGSDEEVEIRAMTVLAVDAIRKAFLARGRKVSSAQVDNWLWQLGQMDTFREKPYHRCRTIYY